MDLFLVTLLQVYASGYGAYGRLGIGGTDNVTIPTALPTLSTRGIAVKKLTVHSGGKHCLVVTQGGNCMHGEREMMENLASEEQRK